MVAWLSSTTRGRRGASQLPIELAVVALPLLAGNLPYVFGAHPAILS